MSVSGGTTMKVIISKLNAATTYTITVAAVNSVATGMYSSPITKATSGSV